MAQRDTDLDRRGTPRSETFFVAVEHEGDDMYYRVITDLSRSGCRFEDPAAPRRIGDPVDIELHLRGGQPFRVRGEIRRELGRAAERQVGVRFVEPPLELAQLLAELPRR
jgi:hypothetical protein